MSQNLASAGEMRRILLSTIKILVSAALLYILGISIFLPDRVGMDDPQLLAEAMTTAGLYLYIKSKDNLLLLSASALA